MNEKEKEKWLDIIDDFEHDFMAIIAYQVTRIADRLMIDTQNMKLVKDDGSVIDLIPTDTPTPDDALVEALGKFKNHRNWEWDASGFSWISPENPQELAKAALKAAHKKAVRDGT